MKPRDASTKAELASLSNDTMRSGEYQIVVDGSEVYLAEISPTGVLMGAVAMPKQHFDGLIDFYNRDQGEVERGGG